MSKEKFNVRPLKAVAPDRLKDFKEALHECLKEARQWDNHKSEVRLECFKNSIITEDYFRNQKDLYDNRDILWTE